MTTSAEVLMTGGVARLEVLCLVSGTRKPSAHSGRRLHSRYPKTEPGTMLLEALRANRQAIAAAGREYGARRIRVFGSVARGEESSDSDVDFLVDFPLGYDLFSQRMPLAERLAEITGRKVDLVPEHELNRHLRARVLAEAVDL